MIVKKYFGFENALHYLKQGKRICRSGWNGKGMWLVIAYATGNFDFKESAVVFNKEYNGQKYLENFIVMKTADNKLVPWLASQTDLLTDDWMLFE